MSSEGLPKSSFLILLALADQPRHGLAILDQVAEASGGRVTLGPGTLYGALQKLTTAGLIKTAPAPDPQDDDPRRRYYRLTPKGERALRDEAARMQALVRAAVAHRVLGER